MKQKDRNTFLAMLLTSKIKDDRFHCIINFIDKQNSAILTQIKTIDAKRLRYKIGNISKQTFEKLERRFVEFYKITPQDRGEATLTKSEQRINTNIILNKIKEVKS